MIVAAFFAQNLTSSSSSFFKSAKIKIKSQSIELSIYPPFENIFCLIYKIDLHTFILILGILSFDKCYKTGTKCFLIILELITQLNSEIPKSVVSLYKQFYSNRISVNFFKIYFSAHADPNILVSSLKFSIAAILIEYTLSFNHFKHI